MMEAAIGVVAFALGCLLSRRGSHSRLMSYPGQDLRTKLQAALAARAEVVLSPDEARQALKSLARDT